MRKIAWLCLVCLVGASFAGTLLVGSPAEVPAGQAHPTLRFVNEKGYRISVKGVGWSHKTRVTFAVRQGSTTEGLELRTTAKGPFVVGVNNIDLCGRSLFKTRDFKGHSARVRGPALECASPDHPPVPVLTVVKGHELHIAVTHVDTPPKHTIVIGRGNALYLWLAGQHHPSFTPSAPKKYFALIGQGTTPPRACPQIECAAGFFWEWVGLKLVRTAITMTPWCRRYQPPCEGPSYTIRVRIIRPL